MDEPLYIPPSKRIRGLGLTVYCYQCKTNVSDVCKETGKPLQKCPFGGKHVFKDYQNIPKGGNSRRTKVLKTRNLNEAIKQAIDFAKEVKENGKPDKKTKESKIEIEQAENTPRSFVNAIARYMAYLHNENVPMHRQKNRSKAYLKEIDRTLTDLAEGLKKSKFDPSVVEVNDLDDAMVGKVYEHLNKKGFSPRSFNKYLKHCSGFINWYIKEYNAPLRNWFESVNRKKTNTNPLAITQEEYNKLLQRITPENGIQKYPKGKKHERNFFRPWLKDGIALALESGRRREEVSTAKYSDIIHSDDGIPLYIKVEDYKVNRIQGRTEDDEKKYIYIPVTESLKELLVKMGYEKYQNSDKYILAPDATVDRVKGMPEDLTRGFTHFYKQLNTGRELTFKCLRKTYITNLSIFMGGNNAKAISGHSNDEVIERHYLAKETLAKVARGFKIFGPEIERKNELEDIRNNSRIKENGLEVAK
ncbi:MAG: tyrosine-type recombinase/integrase [Bacteroidia bacterium]